MPSICCRSRAAATCCDPAFNCRGVPRLCLLSKKKKKTARDELLPNILLCHCQVL